MANVFVKVAVDNRAKFLAENNDNNGLKFIETMTLTGFKTALGIKKGGFKISTSKDGETCYFWCRTKDGVKVTGTISNRLKAEDDATTLRPGLTEDDMAVSVVEDEEGQHLMLHSVGEEPEANMSF